ncbi:MAG: hypothetical protein VKM92_02610 [Cyanobacteriota bacterium]|nr:hypothetical protein [Cyanobacteriota bacterium]
MPKPSPLTEIRRLQRSCNPQGSPITAETLQTYLSREQQAEVVELLNRGPTVWERRYPPLPQHAAQVAEVVVRCSGELAEVVLKPLTPAPSTASR